MASTQDSITPVGYNSPPPSYTATPERPEDFWRIAEQEARARASLVPAGAARVAPTLIDDDGLPEVVVAKESEKIVAECPTDKIVIAPIGTPTPTYSSAAESTPNMTQTVTPLHLLGDQSDTVDCPFCQRRVVTRVKKSPSLATHAAATTLLLTTGVGAVAPYAYQWKGHVSHYCLNCNRKVAHRRYNQQVMQPLGTPEHLRESSRFPEADMKQKEQKWWN
ncbi:hypothetical protein GQ53DRAFT_118581 [Thozetella sp. PMI_491]|nr:hypothetical protein GQ53DRAFT_118581 [Thozetella sp. PMI_491]